MSAPGKDVVIQNSGKEFRFLLKTEPYTGLNDLWVESRKHFYLKMIGIVAPDDETMRKAKWLATCELVILQGLQFEQHPEDQLMYQRAKAVGDLPPDVINEICDEYFNQFKEVEDPKKS
jgi:hypothetical protein